MNILAGFRAIERTPCAFDLPTKQKKKHQEYKRLVRKMSQKEISANNEAQTSTVVKMCLDGFTINEIKDTTKVSVNHIHGIKRKFGLVRASLSDHKRTIKNLLMESPPLTYQLGDLTKITSIDKNKVSRIIKGIPQIKKGTKNGTKLKYWYDFDVKIGSGSISRGTVY